MRAFVATLDAIIAVLMITAMVTATAYFIQDTEPFGWEAIHLQRIGSDVLTSIEKSGAAGDYIISSDSSMLRNVTEMAPEGICVRVSLYAQGSPSSFYSYSKQGCRFSVREAVLRRQAVVYDDAHGLQQWIIMKGQVWAE